MSNVTPLPPPARVAAAASAEAAMVQARVLAMRIMGAAMLPRDVQMLQLAHRLGTIQAHAEALISQLGVAFPPAPPVQQPGENQSA